MPPGVLPSQLADWPARALGLVIDWAIGAVPLIILYILAGIVHGGAAVVFILVGWLYSVAVGIYFAIQVGQYGSSPGMRVVGLRCIGRNTGQPIGAGMGVVRAIAHFIDSLICYIGWLFPLWDAQRQTIADKIIGTYVIRVPAEGFSIAPRSR